MSAFNPNNKRHKELLDALQGLEDMGAVENRTEYIAILTELKQMCDERIAVAEALIAAGED